MSEGGLELGTFCHENDSLTARPQLHNMGSYSHLPNCRSGLIVGEVVQGGADSAMFLFKRP